MISIAAAMNAKIFVNLLFVLIFRVTLRMLKNPKSESGAYGNIAFGSGVLCSLSGF